MAQPFWSVAWDVFAWMGHRIFKWHCSVSHIIADLDELFGIEASADWVEKYLRIYQTMVAAREADVAEWASDYANVEDVILTIDGVQSERGHETLYVVRELRCRRVWFAKPLLSSSTPEVTRLLERASDGEEPWQACSLLDVREARGFCQWHWGERVRTVSVSHNLSAIAHPRLCGPACSLLHAGESV